MIKIGTVIWRPVKDGHALNVIPNRGDEDFGFRIDFDSCFEPQLVSGSEPGLVALSKREPDPNWTHALVHGLSKDRRCAFIRFGHDRDIAAYLEFRKVLARQLSKDEPSESVRYKNMEHAFRRINEPSMELLYV